MSALIVPVLVVESFNLGLLMIKPPIYLAGDWMAPTELAEMEPTPVHGNGSLYGWTYYVEAVLPLGNHRFRYWAPCWGDWIWDEAVDTGW